MGLVFLVVLGGLLGWLASIINRSENSRAMWLNVAVGIGGALLTGLVIGPLLGFGTVLDGQYSVNGLLTALAGSIAVLLAVNLLGDRESAD